MYEYLSHKSSLISFKRLSAIEGFRVSTSEKISDIDTADMAALVTRLQSLLLNKDAAQQAYAKISQNSLFDYLK